MKDIIKDILQADEKARIKLANVKQEKDNVSLDVSKQKKVINDHYMDEAKAKLKAHKKDLDDELEQHQVKLRKYFTQSSAEITKQFNSNKERWIKSIYDRCIQK